VGLQNYRTTELQNYRATELQSYRTTELQSYRTTVLLIYLLSSLPGKQAGLIKEKTAVVPPPSPPPPQHNGRGPGRTHRQSQPRRTLRCAVHLEARQVGAGESRVTRDGGDSFSRTGCMMDDTYRTGRPEDAV